MPEVIRSADCGNSPKNAAAEELALALMGVGELAPTRLAESAVWEGAQGARTGRAAIGTALDGLAPADKIRVEQVVTHGRAGSVSGRITRGTETRLFCHVIRFTTAAQREVAHIVSFEHPGGKSHV